MSPYQDCTAFSVHDPKLIEQPASCQSYSRGKPKMNPTVCPSFIASFPGGTLPFVEKRSPGPLLCGLSHSRALEAESIHILRETAA